MKKIFFQIVLSIIIMTVTPCHALDIDSTYPSLGVVERDLNVTINGSGFDGNTRVSMFVDSMNRHKIIGSVSPTENARAVAVEGNRAYVAAYSLEYPDPWSPPIETASFHVVDITDPTSPVIIDSADIQGESKSLYVAGDTAYLASGSAELQIIDLTDLTKPFNINPIANAEDVVVVNNIAYVASGSDGLEIRDVTDPYNVLWMGGAGTPGTATGVAVDVDRNYAYIADGTFGLQIVDITVPSTSTIAKTVDTPGNAVKVFVSGGVAYVADSWGGLQLIDVSVTAQASIAGSLKVGGDVTDITVEGNLAYLSTYGAGLQIVDVSNVAEPVIIGSVLTLNKNPSDVVVKGGLAYVADESLQVIDVRSPALPNFFSSSYTSYANGIIIDGTTAYLFVESEVSDRLELVDISDPFNLTMLNSTELPCTSNTNYNSIPIFDKKIYYISSGCGLQIVDIDPLSLGYLQTTSINVDLGDPDIFAVVGNFAYMATEFELQVVDLNPLSPDYLHVVGSVASSTSIIPSGMQIVDDKVYISRMHVGSWGVNSGALEIYNISDPKNPQHIDTASSLPAVFDVEVISNRAYLTAAGNGIKIVDVNPANAGTTYLEIVGSLDTEGNIFYFNTLAGDHLYAYVEGAIMAIDVSNPDIPVHIGSVFIPVAGSLSVQDDLAYVAGANGLSIVPVAVEVDSTYISPSEMTAVLPGPILAGNYFLRVFGALQEDYLSGAVTFTDELNLLTSKAIIVAGGGGFAGNLIWDETRAYANYAYDNLIYQGYRHEDITYLTDESNALARYGSQASGANLKPATRANLQEAILNWAMNDLEASDLLLYMEDHGDSETFLMRGNANPDLSEYLTARELDSWLDDLQLNVPGKVILVYDACKSGSFLARVAPPPGATRITLASSSSDQAAYFLSNSHSFSSHFWSTFTGKTGDKAILTDAFGRASTTMSMYQSAQLDVNGNGVPNEEEDYTSLEGHEGTIYALRRQFSYKDRSKPVITSVYANPSTYDSTVTLYASGVYDIDGDAIQRVWAEIVAPDFDPDYDPNDSEIKTVTVLPELDLTGPGPGGIYQAMYSGFDVNGTYIINFYSEDSSGIFSLPQTSIVTRFAGATKLVPDQYEDDNSANTAQVITLNSPTPQNHSFHVSGDEDWVMFYGIGGEFYNVKALYPTIISDPVIDIFSSRDLVNPVMSSNTAGPGEDEIIIGWNPELPFGQGKLPDGEGELYYVRISNSSTNPHYGANVRYKLQIYTPIAPTHPGMVAGRIISGGVGVGGAIIRVGTATAITASDGTFILHLMPGSYLASVSCSGYQAFSFPVTVTSGDVVSYPGVDMNSIPRIINAPPPTIEANKEYNFTPVVIDVDGDPLSYSITGKPSWAEFSTAIGNLWGTPGGSDVGSHGPIRISVTDTAGAVDSIEFTVVVVSNPVGSLPSIYMLLLRP